jgi:acrylyl-CoA reductase (NADPH)
MEKFRAYRIFEENGKVASRFAELALDELDPGEVVIRTEYASVNYKDALAATGAGKIIRRFPCNGGIDAAGTVVSSSNARFKAGDQVIAHGHGLGVAHDGGYSGFVRAPADWVMGLPPGFSTADAITLGVAGYTSALAIHIMQQNGLAPGNGKVLVNGATGGCGSIAIDLLAGLGFHVVALTGKDAEHDYLKALGAAEVLSRATLELGKRPLEKSLWAAALDSVGGEQLAWLTRTMQTDGLIASFGNAGGIELNTTVLPFILRGVRLLGVNSDSPPALRKTVWDRLATDLKPRHLAAIRREVGFDELPGVFQQVLKGGVRGRSVVRIS